MDYPSRLARQLAEGELDVALIPSVEYLRGACEHDYAVLPGMAIAARGPVRSVKLFCRVAPERIERLALDEGSRTSQVLAQVWLHEAHGVRPAVVERLPMGQPMAESTADAVLLIGDRAMQADTAGCVAVVDLAQAWNTLTGLPFVFAFWVARRDQDLGELPAVLRACRDAGLADAGTIAAEEAPRLGLAVASCVDYLTRVLSYDLGEPELAGFERFAALAGRLGLVPEGVRLVFHDHRLDPAACR
jgi:chorismate dehydratase